jgi:hypothetical protein
MTTVRQLLANIISAVHIVSAASFHLTAKMFQSLPWERKG